MYTHLKNSKWFVTISTAAGILLASTGSVMAHGGGGGGGFGGGMAHASSMGMSSRSISRTSSLVNKAPTNLASKSLASSQVRNLSLNGNKVSTLNTLKNTSTLATSSQLNSSKVPVFPTGTTGSAIGTKVNGIPVSSTTLNGANGAGSVIKGIGTGKVNGIPVSGTNLNGTGVAKLPPNLGKAPGAGGTGGSGTGTGGSGTGTGGSGTGTGGSGSGTGTGTGGTGTGGSGTGTGGTGTGTGGMGSGTGTGNCYPGGWCGPFGGLGLYPFFGGLGGFGGYGNYGGGGYGGGGYVSGGATSVIDSSTPVATATPADTIPSTVATGAAALNATPVAPAAVQGVDLQLLDVRLLDNGDATQQIGPRYRVTLRNAGTVPANHDFNVALVAADNATPSDANLPTVESRIHQVGAGDAMQVDLRLPAAAFEMGADSHSEFSKLFVVVDSHQEVNDVNRDNNGAGVDRVAIQPAT